jgi:hypothetical protein
VCFLFVFLFVFFWWSSIISLFLLASPGAHSKSTDRISRIVPLGSRDDANDVGYNQGLSHDGNSTVSLSLVACRVATLLFVFVVLMAWLVGSLSFYLLYSTLVIHCSIPLCVVYKTPGTRWRSRLNWRESTTFYKRFVALYDDTTHCILHDRYITI